MEKLLPPTAERISFPFMLNKHFLKQRRTAPPNLISGTALLYFCHGSHIVHSLAVGIP